jgi:hypothetical protein
VTRYTTTIRPTKIRLVIEVEGERDESNAFRHRWETRVTLGELQASGPNTKAVAESLTAELLALARSPGARQALALEQQAAMVVFNREQAELGTEAAMQRARTRSCGSDPDAPQMDRTIYPEDDAP